MLYDISNLQKRRKSMHLTTRQLSDISGVGKSTISDIESYKHIPKLDVLIMLCNALNCHIDDIVKY